MSNFTPEEYAALSRFHKSVQDGVWEWHLDTSMILRKCSVSGQIIYPFEKAFIGYNKSIVLDPEIIREIKWIDKDVFLMLKLKGEISGEVT